MQGCECDHSKDWHGIDGCDFPECTCRRTSVVSTRSRPKRPAATAASRRAVADRERAERIRRTQGR